MNSKNLTSSIKNYLLDTEATPMINPSDIIEHIYCPRFTYFIHCLKIDQHEETRYKVLKGREIHKQRGKQNKDYIRKRINCIDKKLNVYLASPKLRVRGEVDEVLTLFDGSMAPLDYKFTEYTDFIFETHRIQSTIYAMLISETYGKPVKRGYICYVRDGSKLKEVIYQQKDYERTIDIINEIFNIIQLGYFPRKTPHRNKCIDCCYKNICV